jgi:hypothetical protein
MDDYEDRSNNFKCSYCGNYFFLECDCGGYEDDGGGFDD